MMKSADPPPPQNTLICRLLSSLTTSPLARARPDVGNQLIDEAPSAVASPGLTDRKPTADGVGDGEVVRNRQGAGGHHVGNVDRAAAGRVAVGDRNHPVCAGGQGADGGDEPGVVDALRLDREELLRTRQRPAHPNAVDLAVRERSTTSQCTAPCSLSTTQLSSLATVKLTYCSAAWKGNAALLWESSCARLPDVIRVHPSSSPTPDPAAFTTAKVTSVIRAPAGISLSVR